MTTPPTIAVAHYPEGAGHATRMLGVANALESAGADVRMAGGGAGTQFVALNGYDEFEPTTVDYVDTYQDGSLRRVLAESVPATAARVSDYVEWIRAHQFDALVTDDMFAAIAATRTDVPFYALKHDVPALYRDRVERAGATFHTEFQIAAAREFFYPAVWPPSDDEPDGTTRIPPVALGGDGRDRPAPEVVVVPSHYSELGRIADRLDRQGYDVVDVGSDDWDPVPSLLPYLRDADVVVCSGYSTVMDAAVAGTPCVVYPATDEQDAVADWLERFDVTGFAVADEPLDVLEAVDSPPTDPSFENGATVVADAVLDDLREGGAIETGDGRDASRGAGTRLADAREAAGRAPDESATATGSRARRAERRIGDGTVAGATALGTAMRVASLRAGRYAEAAGRLASKPVATAARQALRASHFAAVAAALLTVKSRSAVKRCRRHAPAVAAFSVATLIVTRWGLRRTASSLEPALAAAASLLWTATVIALSVTATGTRAGADVAASALDRLAGLGRRLRDAAQSSL